MAKNIVPYPTLSDARLRARERRKWLLEILAEEQDGLPKWVVEETAPSMTQPERFTIADYPAECFGQIARIRVAVEKRRILLLERATDAVLPILRLSEGRNEAYPELVKIMPLYWNARARGLFPWRIVVSSYQLDRIKEGLAPTAEWLGIGVDIDKPRRLTHFGRCRVGDDGMDGLVGGVVRFRETYGITCHHVISSACKSLAKLQHISQNPASIPFSSVPDAVLLNYQNSCFEAPIENAEVVNVATTSLLERCMRARVPVRQTHPESQGALAGVIKAIVSTSPIGKTNLPIPSV